MSPNIDFDESTAHRHFSVKCFNQAWDWIDKTDRTDQESEQMLLLSLASLWHWSQREDCTSENLSIGYWQVSRVYSLLGQVENARRFGQRCLEVSQGEKIPPFYMGYAYEALARAESVAGDQAAMGRYLQEARRLAETLPDLEAREQLSSDLDTIR